MKRLILLAVVAAAGCSSVDAEGMYTISVTNRANGCNLENWTVGDTASNVALTIHQQEDNVTGELAGGAAIVFDIWLGSHTFLGHVSGNTIDMVIEGERAYATGNCAYTMNASVLSNLNGDVLTGTIEYSPATNGNTDCAGISGCVSYQDMNGTRPPT